SLDEMLGLLPQEEVRQEGELAVVPDDKAFADLTRKIIDDEISNGEGCNFVVPRFFRGRVADFGLDKALSVYRRLLENEYGSYWTFLYFTGEQYFVGATPERHFSCQGGRVKMNPISGTFRKMEHEEVSALPALSAFLGNQKEIFELLMVVDEELKMMAEVCSEGGQVVGPMIKEMSKLLHTEYVLAGKSTRDVIDMLRISMFAATVVGSPVENACRVNVRHQHESRRYYGSALALLGRDEQGNDTLDSPITIRMAEIALNGCFEIGAGSTIVRDSDPASETAETTAKARGLLAALGFYGGVKESAYRLGVQVYGEDMMIRLSSRNAKLSRFWIEQQDENRMPDKRLIGKSVVIIDNEDSFTRMLAHMLRALGMVPKIIRNESFDPACDEADVVVLGPGPGDPRNKNDKRIVRASKWCRDYVESGKPLLCICLGHQILCDVLGFSLEKKKNPFQGAQEVIDLWGRPERVGFYNAFTGIKGSVPDVEISCDEKTGEIHALRGKSFIGLQFHPESILTTNGLSIVRDVMVRLV
ncbi:MAG TPA: phenazine-specific anthranilate synthase component I, partial [Rhodospirillaceae bacterium]|nr:phenazine-specific anthranilate synthase component I [Rhodospirillaceae bacterium]